MLLRSLLMFGQAKGFLKGDSVHIESISGECELDCSEVRIDRWYGGDQSIRIKCEKINDRLRIETGTGQISLPNAEAASANLLSVQLGQMHKGRLSLSGQAIQIV
jgi:hypothetical protein